jgi:hypothetical protein
MIASGSGLARFTAVPLDGSCGRRLNAFQGTASVGRLVCGDLGSGTPWGSEPLKSSLLDPRHGFPRHGPGVPFTG